MCGEWDAGGLPVWLLSQNPSMAVRTNDETYMAAVEHYWGTLLPKVVPYLYQNGGPIVMVQVSE
jgi:beta-galactosidase